MRCQVDLKYQFRVLEYLTITSLVWFMYLIWLVPFMLYWVQIEWDQFINWLITGTIFQMIFSYPIVKASIKYGPKITIYWERISDNYARNKNKGRITSNKANC